MRTNIVIDDQLITDVQKITGIKTKKGVVEEGLKLLLRLKRQQLVRSRRGKLKWTGNLETMRLDKKA
ncbi:MAG: type II toxin-antitoxin system VapB family antitoxin [Nitrospirota bacterium]|nr:type II toxin-antitoxin system VapB family antitoxin [Nitrospirota bacterium]